MNRIVVWSMTVLAATACTDSFTSPQADPGDPLFFASHGSILAPSVSGSASGDDVTVSWTWSDPEDSWDLVSFKLLRDDVELVVSIANSKPYTAPTELSRSVTDSDLPTGAYEYCVEVMAKYSDVIPALTHHSSACTTVTVGAADVFTHAVSNALSSGTAITALPVNANRWDLVFGLLRNGVPMSCSAPPAELSNVTVTGVVTNGPALTFHGSVVCSTDDSTLWKVQVNNPSPQIASDGTFTFGLTWSGTGQATANSAEPWATTLPNGNPNSGPTSGRR